MKIVKTSLALASAFAMLVTPVIASASSASKLSVTQSVRAGAAVKKSSNDLGGGSTIIAVLAGLAVVAGIVIAADGKKKSP
jgi:hypothetical protein